MTSYGETYGTTTALRPFGGTTVRRIFSHGPAPGPTGWHPKPRRMPLLSSPGPVLTEKTTLDIRASIMLNDSILYKAFPKSQSDFGIFLLFFRRKHELFPAVLEKGNFCGPFPSEKTSPDENPGRLRRFALNTGPGSRRRHRRSCRSGNRCRAGSH